MCAAQLTPRTVTGRRTTTTGGHTGYKRGGRPTDTRRHPRGVCENLSFRTHNPRNRGCGTVAFAVSAAEDGLEESSIIEEEPRRLEWMEEDSDARPRAYLIFNPVAGKDNLKDCLGTITTTLLPSMDLTILQTTPTITAADLTKKALKEDADIIIASGGDGTISEVAGALIGTGKPLGVIPRGTANAFACSLNIPTHLDSLDFIKGACNVILDGSQRVVDAGWAVGEWGKWPLTLLLGIGLEAETVEMADREMKNKIGPLAYMLAGAQAMTRNDAVFGMSVVVDDDPEPYEMRTMAATIANVAPATSILSQGLGQVIPDDGLLEMLAFTSETPNEAASQLFSLAVKQILFKSAEGDADGRAAVGIRASKVRMDATPPQKVVVDGEVLGNTPVEVEVVPASLVVLAPLPSEDVDRSRAVSALKSEMGKLNAMVEAGDGNTELLQSRIKSICRQVEEEEKRIGEAPAGEQKASMPGIVRDAPPLSGDF